MKRLEPTYFLFLTVVVMLLLGACSTTKVLEDDKYRLKSNVITVENAEEYPDYKISGLDKYIRQKPNTYFFKTKKGGWNPFLYVANWTNGKGGGWDKFVTKLGQAPVEFRPSLVNDSKSNLQTHLKYNGYYNSTVTDSIELKKQQAVVYYNVRLGKQYPIKKIFYQIDDPTLREFILADTLNSFIKVGVPLSEGLLDSEIERSAAYLRNNGYYDFSKNYYFFAADTVSVKDSALLRVIVKNYTRNETPEDAKPHRQFYIGDVYINPISDNLRYRTANSLKIPQVMDTVKHHDLTILYDKNRKIRPSILDRMNRLHKGDLYSENLVNSTYQRFSNLRLYSSVNVELTKVDTNVVDCMIRLLPSKTHGYSVSLEASVNTSGLFGISPTVSYLNRNIFRGGEWLSLSVSGNFQFSATNSTRANEFGASAGLSFPTFVLLPDRVFKNIIPRTDLAFSYNFQQRPEYTRNMIGGNFGWSWSSRSNKFYYKLVPVQINLVNLPKMSPGFLENMTNPFVREAYKNQFEFGLGFDIQYSSDPSINPDRSFFKANLQFDMSGNLLSAFNKFMPTDSAGYHTVWNAPYSQFARIELSVAQTWKFGKNNKQALAVRALGGFGYAYGNSAKMPFERLFWAGGANSLRGWSGRSVGPGSAPMDTTFSIPNQTGDMRLEANIEYRFPLFSVFRGAVFFDWGNIWNIDRRAWENIASVEQEAVLDESYFSFKNMLRTSSLSGGIGLRVDINFVVIRLDLGFKLYDPAKQDWNHISQWFRKSNYALQFGIGYPF